MSTGRDTFDRLARVIGDLDHPFYAEERQRDVWNEASAVGFQAMIWGTLGLSAAMAWFGSQDVRPWTLALLVVSGLSSMLMIGYVQRRQITGTEGGRFVRPRMVLVLALYLLVVAGLLVRRDGRAAVDLDAATLAGMVVGATVTLGLFALALRWARGRRGAGEEPDEQ